MGWCLGQSSTHPGPGLEQLLLLFLLQWKFLEALSYITLLQAFSNSVQPAPCSRAFFFHEEKPILWDGGRWVTLQQSLLCIFKLELVEISINISEKAMAPHSSTFAWKIPWTEEPGRLQSMGSLESDTTEWLHFHFSFSRIEEGNGNPLYCSCLENPRDGGAWWAALYGVAQSRTRLRWLSSSSINIYMPCRISQLFWQRRMPWIL